MEQPPATTWSRPTKYVVGVALAIFGVFLLFISSSVIPLLVVAGLLAFTVRPVIGLLHHRLRLPLGVAVGLTYLVVLLLLPLAALVLLSAVGQALRFVFSTPSCSGSSTPTTRTAPTRRCSSGRTAARAARPRSPRCSTATA